MTTFSYSVPDTTALQPLWKPPWFICLPLIATGAISSVISDTASEGINCGRWNGLASKSGRGASTTTSQARRSAPYSTVTSIPGRAVKRSMFGAPYRLRISIELGPTAPLVTARTKHPTRIRIAAPFSASRRCHMHPHPGRRTRPTKESLARRCKYNPSS
jgi:hypothetical protein